MVHSGGVSGHKVHCVGRFDVEVACELPQKRKFTLCVHALQRDVSIVAITCVNNPSNVECAYSRTTGDGLGPPSLGKRVHVGRLVRARGRSVRGGALDPEARLYYRFYVGTQVGDKYLCVIVKVRDADAFVLTVYLTDKIKRGAQLWPKEN